MTVPANTVMTLDNPSALLSVDLYGGAITRFQLKDQDVNPLSFAFTKEQMPDNNKNGAPYQGHFLCLGRWGLPSGGEIKKGMPSHGEAANRLWQSTFTNRQTACMQMLAPLEGLQVERKLTLHSGQPVICVNEKIENVQPLGRLYNVVQHPTLAAPFLYEKTVIDCNGTKGFDQQAYQSANDHILHWPFAKDDGQKRLDLRTPTPAYNAVFSFIVSPLARYGWITAYSPRHQLLIGYVWKRTHYPWIHLWQHWKDQSIQYRGIEFGTAGIHQPFKEILHTAVELFGEKTVEYIDASEAISKSYVCFLQRIDGAFSGVEDIQVAQDCIQIHTKNNKSIIIQLSKQFLHELQ